MMILIKILMKRHLAKKGMSFVRLLIILLTLLVVASILVSTYHSFKADFFSAWFGG